jgi:nucleoside diphosphate kinase
MDSMNSWTWLTLLEKKAELYSQDVYFREGYDDLKDWLGGSLETIIPKYASIILKPEAIAHRKAHDCINFLCRNGFDPVAFKTFRFNRHLIRDLWRFQFNGATRERLDTLDMWSRTTDIVYVVLKSKLPQEELSASHRLTKLKWHSNPARHNEWELRKALGQNIIMLNYIHSTDESADFVRDFGVLFSPDERKAIISDINADSNATAQVLWAIDTLYRSTDFAEITFEAAMRDIEDRVLQAEAQMNVGELVSRIRGLSNQILAWEKENWREMLANIDELWLPISTWTRIILRAHLGKLTFNNWWPAIPSILSAKL